MSTDPTAAGCTDPCIACMTGESHDPAPTPTETDEQRTDRITLNRDQLAALLAHHADTLAAHLRTDPARDRWIAAEQLDAHALALTAGEETSVVRELLDSILAFEAEQPAPPSVPADADLRDRIRRACAEADGFRFEGLESWDYQTHADKLLAVLPPLACRRLLARLEADRAGHLRATVRAKAEGAGEVLVAVGGASAAALRHAAARVVSELEGPDAAQAYMQRTEGGEEGPPFDVEAGLQRLADDLQRGETGDGRAALVEGPQTVTHNANESTARADSATACGQNLRYESPPADLAPMFDGLHRLLVTSSRDWGEYRVDAWLYAVLVGWDCEQAHEHDALCDDGTMAEVAEEHGWDADTVAKARRYRAAVRRMADEAQQAGEGR